MQRRVIAGGPGDFLTVHHLTVRGTQVEIGAALASEARDHFGWRPPATGDPIRNRARRKWFERNWPEQHARMAGVAEAFDQDIDDDAFGLRKRDGRTLHRQLLRGVVLLASGR
jgi:hypothetical protein